MYIGTARTARIRMRDRVRTALSKLSGKHREPRRIAILGVPTEAGTGLREELSIHDDRYRIVTTIDGSSPEAAAIAIDLVERREVDLVLLGPDAPKLALFNSLAQRGIRPWDVEIDELADFAEQELGLIPIAQLNAAWLQWLLHPGHPVGTSRVKRVMDVLVAGIALVVLAPLLLLCALLISRDGGPVLFVQERVGRGGRAIRVLKLRTMTVPQSSGVEASWTVPDDQRITRVGRILRRLHLDEAPQLINVLRGDMSLVGPRPEQVPFARRLERELPFYAYRHLVRPGITGWAQVHCGYAGSELGSAWKLSHDLYYIKRQSLRLDVKILFLTLGTLARGQDQAEPDRSDLVHPEIAPEAVTLLADSEAFETAAVA